MTIKEIETRSAMERGNIRFYEREGLIAPSRMDNRYRDYSEDDLQVLLRVKLLRSLHISLDEIHALKDGSENLADTLAKRIAELEQEKQGASYAQEVCCVIRADGATFADLDAKKYLDGIECALKETGNPYFVFKDDETPQVFYPWRRYFARMLDTCLYSTFWFLLMKFLLHINISNRGFLGNILDMIVGAALMLFLEPLWLHLFGTTLGKKILGLRIESADGRLLSYSEGIDRTWGVFSAGMGYGIPIYSAVRNWKSYKLCKERQPQPWDESISYTIKDTKLYRGILCVGIYIALLTLVMSATKLPPNRGNLTIAKYAENHNFYAEYLGVNFGGEYLGPDGKWEEKAHVDGVFEISFTENPEYAFTVENGYVTGVSFAVEQKGKRDWIESYNKHMIAASFAYAGAQWGPDLLSWTSSRIKNLIEYNEFEDFTFIAGGVVFDCDVEYSGYGYSTAGFLIPEENAKETYFRLKFSIIEVKDYDGDIYAL